MKIMKYLTPILFTGLLIVVMSLFIGNSAQAAVTGKLSGRIVDGANGDPLPGANVIIQGTTLGAATD